MKKCWCLIVLACLLLTACGSAETFETLGPVQHQPEAAPVLGSVVLSLPESAVAEVFGGTEETVYDCGGYTLVLQTLSSGDFRSTMQSLSGFLPENSTVMESQTGNTKRYDWVWTAAGEEGELICRASVLDDGNYHYCITAMAPAQKAGALSEDWNRLFGSFALE